ncbi:MAG: TIGR04283 family arsenosugar biosynthesis glycosyltransferase [Hyphomonadaceae bacterium]|nr:TIGR04283 family arsenosugar biosynthesis glycosyltransferase [Hyphomonadaceae bacterium]
MISVIIPTLNAQSGLAATLTALVPATVAGIVREVIIVDGGSTDRTELIADQAGAQFLARSGGRGYQLLQGAHRARFPWLLFLHADTVLEPGWEREAMALVDAVNAGKRPLTAAAFRFALDDAGLAPRALERLVRLRCALFRLPYGDQGLLLPKLLYTEIGGYSALPLMEDVDIARKLKRRRLAMLQARAVTDAQRFRRSGYVRRSVRNLACLTLYFLRMPTNVIARIYG